jgi:leucyl-tRNA synthetase
MADTYNHKDIEEKWQKTWEQEGIYKTENSVPGKDNFYTLVEFAYPSGNLHVGHWYAFSVPDIYARYKRMQGKNVLYPIGFDSFGLPAENAAIKRGLDPKKWTYENMDTMRMQLRSMGAMFDWNRAVATSDPEYYRWTQWMFNKFFERDLVYRATTKVNWCPKDQTILANEQVVNGKCERCDTEVVQKDQDQWSFRITKYADRLHDDLENLDWPESIKESQRNWIGRSEGAEIDFKVPGNSDEHSIKVFTTRPETIFGATFLAVSAGLAKKWLDIGWPANDAIKQYVAETLKEQGTRDFKEKEKTGIAAGFNAVNPATKEEIPVWITNYVLDGIGTGAIMAVPAHDERDFEFAKKFGLAIKSVVAQVVGERNKDALERDRVCAIIEKDGKILCDKIDETQTKFSGQYILVGGGVEDGETPEEAIIREIEEETGVQNTKIVDKIGVFRTSWFSKRRQVYRTMLHRAFVVDVDLSKIKSSGNDAELVWVEIDELIKHFHDCGDIDQALILERYKNKKNGLFIGEGELVNSTEFNGLSSNEAKQKIVDFVGGKMAKTYRLRDWGISRQRYWGVPIPIVYDPEGKAHAIPDEHLPWLLPTDVDHTPDGTAPLARSKELLERTEKIFGKGWKPEVETMDTFVDSSWYFYRYLDPKNEKEFCGKIAMENWMPINMYFGGAEHTTMHLLYSRFWNKALFDLGLVKDSEPYAGRRNRGLILGPDGNKMSKSKGNVIDPDELVRNVGADTVRMYLAFMGPYGVADSYPWDPNGFVGIRRFLERVWNLKEKISEESNLNLDKTIKKLEDDIERLKFNTAISGMMIFVNQVEEQKSITKENYKKLLQILAPFAPHMTEEIWRELGEQESIHLSTWPSYDESKIRDEHVKIIIQINGKVRGEIDASLDEGEETVKERALAAVREKIGESPIKKVIYVPGRIVNIVI